MSRRLATTLVSILALVAGPASTAGAGPAGTVPSDTPAPVVTGLTWHPRAGTASSPILSFTLRFDAPAGLDSGEVRLGSVFHEVLATEAIGPHEPGTHSVDLSFVPSGDKVRPWEVIGVTLNGSDGRTTSYGFCELVGVVETREKASSNRLSVDCLDGPGWVVYTLRAEPGASGMIWMRGVATRDNTYAGVGHVMQDVSGAVVRWGTATSVVYPQGRDGTYVSVGGNTVVNEPSADPSAQPGPHRIVVGIGGSTPALEAGATYRWAAYYATRPGHFDLPFISLEGSGLAVLSVETGASAGIAWGKDFDHSVAVERSAPDAAIVADGHVTRSFAKSTTCMFTFLGGRIADVFSASVQRIEGPEGPVVGGVVVAGQPGTYGFEALAGAGQSWGQYVVGYADMPMTPAP